MNKIPSQSEDTRSPGDDAWLGRSRATLDESVDRLDAATLSALNRARQRAVAAVEAQRWRGRWPAALAIAASLAVAVLLVRPAGPPPAPAVDTLGVRDLELVADADFELYEDWEFYAWLEAQPADG